MTVTQALIEFLVAVSILTITPGVDTALVLRTAAAGGSRRAAFTALGVAVGCLIWGAAAAVGLGALLIASTTAFTVVKWSGATYLVWLGVKLLLKPRRSLTGAASPATESQESLLAALRRGFLTNILNPKVGLFYITFLPQFVPPEVNLASFTFLLACIHVSLALMWFAALIAATVPLSNFLARRRVMTVLDRMTGCVFVYFGLNLALGRQQ
ncbi:LysE family translocator [Azomonas macrocytogenes]|uniref:Threonine/homoserine/homoserine lactone efflux protein n=1 Tax=Azomonas macrocytogenes TaxID=69962 RepID=A0A839T6Z3_AZOMA|nr:LysE family translocator [Azomonas macrocytogenes]MBB3105222.1 threonine/homoserine/homoserine lactone efflux protein [Azomonas macrocytogenes]